MKRTDLEHIIRAAADIAADNEIIIIGSQAILAFELKFTGDLIASMEADVFPKNYPERADLIDGTIGEGSPFHATFGYYAQGVAATTAVLPKGWQERLVAIQNENTRGAIGWCLECHDLIISKYVANRPKDLSFIRAAIEQKILNKDILLLRILESPINEELKKQISIKIESDFRKIL
ncbi:MAG: hypothetical protein JW841_14590 [Deltaproteobacteria bacterium]|nr:hypothetical protein [Deltaproteobacteria bacterium]